MSLPGRTDPQPTPTKASSLNIAQETGVFQSREQQKRCCCFGVQSAVSIWPLNPQSLTQRLNIHRTGRVPTLKELDSSSHSEFPAGEDHRNTNKVTPGGSQNLEAARRLLTSKKPLSIHCTGSLGKEHLVLLQKHRSGNTRFKRGEKTPKLLSLLSCTPRNAFHSHPPSGPAVLAPRSSPSQRQQLTGCAAPTPGAPGPAVFLPAAGFQVSLASGGQQRRPQTAGGGTASPAGAEPPAREPRRRGPTL